MCTFSGLQDHILYNVYRYHLLYRNEEKWLSISETRQSAVKKTKAKEQFIRIPAFDYQNKAQKSVKCLPDLFFDEMDYDIYIPLYDDESYTL